MNSGIYKRVRVLALSLTIICSLNLKTMAQPDNSGRSQYDETLKSYVAIFEIPAMDLSRAVSFYESVLNLKIETFEFEGMEMGLLPYEGQMVTGVIVKGEGFKPSEDGTTVYLHGGEDLQIVLDKVVKQGGEVIVPKTPHADESGFFALFLDTEGNKMGLHSPN